MNMSITGSLISYENNNELSNHNNNSSCSGKQLAKRPSQSHRNSILVNRTEQRDFCDRHQQHMGKSDCNTSLNSSQLSNSLITNSSSFAQHSSAPHHSHHLAQKLMNSKRKHAKYNNMHPSHLDQNNYLHLNSLWSIWYGVLLTLFQGYLAVHGAYRFIGCSLIPWKIEPVAELNIQIVLSGVVFILLPFFFTSAVFKVGNLANDGIKLAAGSKGQRCSMSPHDGLEVESRGGTLRALWTHGGPTAAFVHIVIAMCLLLPRLLLEARIIENGLLPREHIWHTELDFIAVNRRNLMVLSVVSSPYQNTSVNVLDYDEDFYNDTTMYTAIGMASGDTNNYHGNTQRNGNPVVVGGVNNNLLDPSGKGTTTTANTAMGKPKQPGKTMYFEVPDLINRGPKNPGDDNGRTAHTDDEGDDGDDEGDGGTGDADGGRSREDDRNSNEFYEPSSEITSWIANGNHGKNNKAPTMAKNYDENWDKLAMVGKGSSIGPNRKSSGSTVPTQQQTSGGPVRKTTAAQNAKTSTRKSTATTPTATTTTSSSSKTPASTGKSVTSTTTTTRSTTSAKPSTTSTTTTTTRVPPTTTTTTTTTTTQSPTTQPTRMHQQQHNHHNNNQQHHHQSQHHSNGSKSTRKHNSSASGRQHHRQRSHHNQNHRRHHQTTAATSTTSSTTGTSTTNGARTQSTELYAGNSAKTAGHWQRIDEVAPPAPGDSYEEVLEEGQRAGPPGKYTTSSTAQTTRDSNIHIVKPEKLPEIIPSTPVSSNSKIIAIKTNAKRMRRMTAVSAADNTQVEIEPDYLLGDMPFSDEHSEGEDTEHEDNEDEDTLTPPHVSSTTPTTTTAAPVSQSGSASTDGIVRLDGFAGMLQIFFGIEKAIDVQVFAQPPSAEFVNLLFALLVWCVRYPAVFWRTTKSFGCIFSIQLITAALDIIFSYVGISSLYKLQVYSEAMPVHNSGLILNGVVTMALFLLSTVLIIASAMIMYLYGHGRLAAKMRDRSLITLKTTDTWIYFAHCASFCFVLALAVVKAPLLNDLSVTYKSNLHCATFLSALVSVVHILLWIVIWLVLTVKRRWTFKLPPIDTYGIITKASTQPLLMSQRNGSSAGSSGAGSTPNSGSGGSVTHVAAGAGSIGVMSANIGNGGGVAVADHKVGIGGGGGGVGAGILSAASSTDGGVDDIYWPKLTPSSPKLKVTFNEVTSTSDDVLLIGDHETQTDGKRHTTRGTAVCFTSVTGEIDDGEYATLRAATAATVVGIGIGGGGGGGGSCTTTGSTRILHLSEYDELPPPPPPLHAASFGCGNGSGSATGSAGDDNLSEEGKLLESVRDDSVTYASTRDLEPPQPPPPLPPHAMSEAFDDLSPTTTISSTTTLTAAKIMCIGGRAPQAMPEVMQLSSSPEHLVSPLAPVTVTVHTNEAHISSSSTPRCLRRADSGVPHEALTPRSDTTSTTESTTSPPERAPSESSSGVHSGEERDVEVVIRPRVACKPPPKPPQPPIQEEPYGRCTNMRMSSFVADPMTASRMSTVSNSSTLPPQRSQPEQKFDYTSHCSTMPLPVGAHHHNLIPQHGGYSTSSAYSMLPEQQQQLQQQLQQHISSFKSQVYANSAVAMAGANAAAAAGQQHQLPGQSSHTTLANGVRYSNPHQLLRRLPHVTKAAAESPYGHLGYGSGHHTFSKLGHEPLHSVATTTIPEDRDSANYSMSSEQDNHLYATANHMH